MATIQFVASLPPIQSAIKRDGSGGGMRIQLDIPESEMMQAVQLLALTQHILKVTIEPIVSDKHGTGTVKRTEAKKRA